MNIKSSYEQGKKKATLERMSQCRVHLVGISNEFFREMLIPYRIKACQAKRIITPNNFFDKLAFNFGYWSYSR